MAEELTLSHCPSNVFNTGRRSQRGGTQRPANLKVMGGRVGVTKGLPAAENEKMHSGQRFWGSGHKGIPQSSQVQNLPLEALRISSQVQ